MRRLDESQRKARKEKWKFFAHRLKNHLIKDNIRVVAAGVAFYFFLALFPSLVAISSMYGFLTDTNQIYKDIEQLMSVLPEGVHLMLSERLESIARQSQRMLGWEAALSIFLSLWIANLGTKTLFDGINIAYSYETKRSFVRENAVILFFTVIGLIVSAFCGAVIVGFPAIGDYLGLSDSLTTLISWSRWIVLAGVAILSLALVYKYAPAKHTPLFRNVLTGAVFAISLWIGGSLLFSFYVTHVNIFEQNYGSESAVVIVMLWFYMTSFMILLGAELNVELEKRSARLAAKASEDKKSNTETIYEDKRAA